MMVALTLVRKHSQQAATELGEELTTDIVLALYELDGPASAWLGDALRLAATSVNSLLEKWREEVVPKLWDNRNEQVEMLNREYPHVRLPVQRRDVESAVSNFFNMKQCFVQLSWERAQSSGHAFPLNFNRGAHRVMTTNHPSQHKPHNWLKNRGSKWKASRRQRNLQPPNQQKAQPSTITLGLWTSTERQQQLNLNMAPSGPPLLPKERYAWKAWI